MLRLCKENYANLIKSFNQWDFSRSFLLSWLILFRSFSSLFNLFCLSLSISSYSSLVSFFFGYFYYSSSNLLSYSKVYLIRLLSLITLSSWSSYGFSSILPIPLSNILNSFVFVTDSYLLFRNSYFLSLDLSLSEFIYCYLFTLFTFFYSMSSFGGSFASNFLSSLNDSR